MNSEARMIAVEECLDVREVLGQVHGSVSSVAKGAVLCVFLVLALWLILPIAAGWVAMKAARRVQKGMGR